MPRLDLPSPAHKLRLPAPQGMFLSQRIYSALLDTTGVLVYDTAGVEIDVPYIGHSFVWGMAFKPYGHLSLPNLTSMSSWVPLVTYVDLADTTGVLVQDTHGVQIDVPKAGIM